MRGMRIAYKNVVMKSAGKIALRLKDYRLVVER
jgi:hypothetical protein